MTSASAGQRVLDTGYQLASTWPAMSLRRRWLFAVLGGAGATMLCASGFSLFASPRLLDQAASLGDAKLYGALAGIFAAGCVLSRLLLFRRRLPEERVDDVVSRARRHLR